MKLKLLTLFVLFAVLTGFSWGKSEKKAAKPKAAAPVSAPAKEVKNAASSAAKPSATAAKATSDPNATVAAVRMLSTGTPEERKARMESLQRLGAALRKKREQTESKAAY